MVVIVEVVVIITVSCSSSSNSSINSSSSISSTSLYSRSVKASQQYFQFLWQLSLLLIIQQFWPRTWINKPVSCREWNIWINIRKTLCSTIVTTRKTKEEIKRDYMFKQPMLSVTGTLQSLKQS